MEELAKKRLLEGRLIKTENCYTIIKSNSIANDDIIKLILDNLTYIGFDNFLILLMKSFKKFFEHIFDKEYIIVYNEDRNKSDLWVLLLLTRYGKQFFKNLYKEPVCIIELKQKTDKIPDDMIYMFCDDFIYSGTQMFYTLEKFALKSKQQNLQNTYIVCAGITKNALKRLGEDRIFYEYPMKTLKELVKPEDHKKIETQINDKFSQPFIDKFNYMNNVPIYMEHKLPDAMSSFPQIIIEVISNCSWNNESRIVDGSDETTMCAHPFYKKINIEKGILDKKNEKIFIEKCIINFGKKLILY